MSSDNTRLQDFTCRRCGAAYKAYRQYSPYECNCPFCFAYNPQMLMK